MRVLGRRWSWAIATALAALALFAPLGSAGWLFRAAALFHAGLALMLPSRQLVGLPALLPPEPEAPRSRMFLWLLAALLAVGLGLRLVHLGTGLWFDEIRTLVQHVRTPLSHIVSDYHDTNQHPLYSVLARISGAFFGESGAALRLPAALLGTASLGAFFVFARQVTAQREALLGTALLTVSYHHVWFSQDARGYSGLLLFTLLATAAFIRLLRDDRAGWGAVSAYAIWAALGAYIHPTAVVVVVAHALVLLALWWPMRRTSPRAGWRPVAGVALASSVTFLLYSPMIPQMVALMGSPNPFAAETAWMSPVWLLIETVRGLGAGVPGGWPALFSVAVVVVAGLVSFWRQSAAMTALMVLPGLLTGIMVTALHHNLWPRFFFFCAGFAVAIGIRGGFVLCQMFFKARGLALATAGGTLVVLASAFTVPRAWQPKQDYEGAGRFVDRSRSAADAVATIDLTVFPYREWLGRDWSEVTGLAELEQIEQRHPRTWVLYTFPIRLTAVQPDVWRRLEERYDTAAVFPGTVGGGAIVVLVTRPTPVLP
jgi:hypothetical protein